MKLPDKLILRSSGSANSWSSSSSTKLKLVARKNIFPLYFEIYDDNDEPP